eukprot:TRINITY_DN9514_c0_g3_i2.p1 TRINITY_DN9514_c0_g3~~TRINITY_DN9514_c0_g3_i2.p1  ORF type:complete len:271 (-),score=109.59 TRINITY_DN9514_c0_g3_i2:22-834(-)
MCMPLRIFISKMASRITKESPKSKPKSKRKDIWCIFNQVPSEPAGRLLNRELEVAEERQVLTELFGLEEFEEPFRSVVVELYRKVLTFCKTTDPQFSAEKLSTLLGIFDVAFKKAVKKDISQQKFYNVFKQLLLAHSIQRPPYSLCAFSSQDVTAIAEFFVEEVYKYYGLYHFKLHPRYELSLNTETLFKVGLPPELPITSEIVEISSKEIPDLKKFFHLTIEEIETEAREKEINEILQIAKTRLQREMDEKMKRQDEDFLVEVQALEKK